MHTTEKLEAESLIKKLPDESTFEDIQYHLYVAEKLKNARQQIKDGKIFVYSLINKSGLLIKFKCHKSRICLKFEGGRNKVNLKT